MRALATGLLLLALATQVGADHCEAWSTSSPEADVAGRYYVDQDCVIPLGCGVDIIPAVWVYEESNGLAGLQRGDEYVDDTCHGMVASDTIIF